MKMRAKFYITQIEKPSESFEKLHFYPVTDKPYGPDGENEDNTFARWTPSGELTLGITNPALIGTFKEGEKYYLDFTLATA